MSANRRRFFRGCLCCEPSAPLASPARRNFLAGGVAALGLGATGLSAIGRTPAAAQAPAAKTRIDVHHHYIPPFHADALASRRSGGRPPQWSPAKSLEDMDKSGIATSIVSVVQPGIWFGNVEESRSLARQCNEYGAKMGQDHPGRFGLFAIIAPPDVEGSLAEIAYALDVLKAEGIALHTSYGPKYLGDPSFDPVYEELNRRKAVVYVHPTNPDCCRGVVPGIAPSTIEYATDSTRTIAHIVFSGTATKFPDIRWIFSHSGGTLPFLTSRFIQLAEGAQARAPAERTPARVQEVLLRAGAGQHAGPDRGAAQDGVDLAGACTARTFPSATVPRSTRASRTGASAPPISGPSSGRTRSSSCRASRRADSPIRRPRCIGIGAGAAFSS